MLKGDSKSIQQLLLAEKRAEERVNQARKRKTIKLKQAKEDALVEIEKFRAGKEKEFKEHESKYLGSQEGTVLKIEKDTENSMKEMETYVQLNKDAIIEYLLEQTFTIECQVHENFREDVI